MPVAGLQGKMVTSCIIPSTSSLAFSSNNTHTSSRISRFVLSSCCPLVSSPQRLLIKSSKNKGRYGNRMLLQCHFSLTKTVSNVSYPKDSLNGVSNWFCQCKTEMRNCALSRFLGRFFLAIHGVKKVICTKKTNRIQRSSDNVLKKMGSVFLIGTSMIFVMFTPAYVNSSTSISRALTEENLLFLEAWKTVDRAYIDKTFNGQSWFRYREEALRREPMNTREETYAAIRKMLASLGDPFTRFLEPEKFKNLRSSTTGSLTGVGLEVGLDMRGTQTSEDLVVISCVAGGPAERAGIMPGEIISAIDGVSTNGIGLYDAAVKLQGPEDSLVDLTLRKGESEFKTVSLRRTKITVNPVSWHICEVAKYSKSTPRIGYIRLASFNQNASEGIKEAIQNLRQNNVDSYVLDLRNNSGGLFPEGVKIAKIWLDKGVIVYICDSKGVRDIFEADGSEAFATSEPLTVLVNRRTASASEILAAALKDNKRAVLLGESTFGKGKIQTVFELSDGSAMVITVARYETPAHTNIDKVGVSPDYPLPEPFLVGDGDFCKCLENTDSYCGINPTLFQKHKAS